MSDSRVAVVAQEPAYFVCLVAVIDGEKISPVARFALVSFGGWLLADGAHSALGGEEFVVLAGGEAVAVFEVSVAPRSGVDARGAVPVRPLLLVVVRRAEPAANGRPSALARRAGNASPLPPLPPKATILWAVLRFLVLT